MMYTIYIVFFLVVTSFLLSQKVILNLKDQLLIVQFVLFCSAILKVNYLFPIKHLKWMLGCLCSNSL